MSDLYGIVPLKKTVDEFDIFHAFSVSDIDQGLFFKIVKRIFDIIAALIFILFFLPVWILIAIIIKVNSKGPILYTQEVIGKNMTPFFWYKFRTMIHNADDGVHRQLIKDMATGVKTDGKKLHNDDRITSVGKVLRKFSLDEFPQLINVLRGEMSLVGPRPMAEYEVELLSLWQKSRFVVIPGITGPWQVYGRNEVGFNDQLVLDKYYVENQSLILDFEILLKTIPVVLFGKGGV
jgi:undecaprenyl-phosphate galactose phosphotransferase